MLLTIDIGNTNTVYGAFHTDGKLALLSRVATDYIKTVDQYAIEIMDIFELYVVKTASFEGAIISSVVPPVTQQVAGAVEILLGRAPMVVGPGLKTGLDIRIDVPSQLGSDLVATAAGALQKYPKPTIIIDMGTATKFSAVTHGAVFLGVAILPGLQISLDALSARSAQLPYIALEKPDRVLGRNSIDSMRSGVLYGNAAMLDGMVDRIEEELGGPAAAVITGGYAKEVASLCRKPMTFDANLLLEGLYWLYKKNS
jgi:type III pantothenate kinase